MKIKKIIKLIIYIFGIVLGIGITSFGWKVANSTYPDIGKASTYKIENDGGTSTTKGLTDYSFGADFYTETYNALYTINENIGALQSSNSENTQKLLNAQQQVINQISDLSNYVNKANINIKQENTRNWGIAFLIIGIVITLIYVEKVVNLFNFQFHRNSQRGQVENAKE